LSTTDEALPVHRIATSARAPLNNGKLVTVRGAEGRYMPSCRERYILHFFWKITANLYLPSPINAFRMKLNQVLKKQKSNMPCRRIEIDTKRLL
jgi:hypothetical protein